MFGRTDSPPSRPVPRLLSLEIFNPETDDMDSDSSGLSSPDSVGSVISIKNEEETITGKYKLNIFYNLMKYTLYGCIDLILVLYKPIINPSKKLKIKIYFS